MVPYDASKQKKIRLPKWFATMPPAPFWLVEHWTLILAVTSAILVFINTVIAHNTHLLTEQAWLNPVVAWINAGALYIQGRMENVSAIALWRQEVRAEVAAKKEQPPE